MPGYAAPEGTVVPAARVSRALADLAAVAEVAAPELDPEVVLRLVAAWTQLFGLVSFELFGQTQGLISAHADLFDATTRAMAAHLGLPAGGRGRPASVPGLDGVPDGDHGADDSKDDQQLLHG